jgi:hypothetical protein
MIREYTSHDRNADRRLERSRNSTVIEESSMSGAALETDSLADAPGIAAASGARVIGATFNRLIERGRGRHSIALLPYPVDNAMATLADVRHLVLVGSPSCLSRQTERNVSR